MAKRMITTIDGEKITAEDYLIMAEAGAVEWPSYWEEVEPSHIRKELKKEIFDAVEIWYNKEAKGEHWPIGGIRY